MSKIIDGFRKRRFQRLMSRAGADFRFDESGHYDEEGHWVTTHETKRRIHINEKGVPDKGNPYILAKMTGTKPKLSAEYRKKMLQEHLAKEKIDKVVHSLKSLPEGSTVTMANGTEYTKTGSGFVSSKSKTGGKQTPQALAKILGGNAKAGKDFNVNPSDISEAENTTGTPTPLAADQPPVQPVNPFADHPPVQPVNPSADQPATQSKPPVLQDFKTTLKGLDDGTVIDIGGKTWVKTTDTVNGVTQTVFVNPETKVHTTLGTFVDELTQSISAGNDVSINGSDYDPGSGLSVGPENAPQPQPQPQPENTSVLKDSPAIQDLKTMVDAWNNGETVPYGACVDTLEDIEDGTILGINGSSWVKTTNAAGSFIYVNPNTGAISSVDSLADTLGDAMENGGTISIDGEEYKHNSESSKAPDDAGSNAVAGTKELIPEANELKGVLDTWAEGAQAGFGPVDHAFKQLPYGTTIGLNGATWTKTTNSAGGLIYKDDTGHLLFEHELKSKIKAHTVAGGSVSINGVEYTPKQPAGTSGSSDTPAVSAAGSFDALSGLAEKMKESGYNYGDVSHGDFEKACKQLKDGASIEMNGQSYVKSTDKDGSPVFKSSKYKDSYGPYGIQNIMEYQIALQKQGLSEGVSFKEAPDHGSDTPGTTSSQAPTSSSSNASGTNASNGVSAMSSLYDKMKSGENVPYSDFKSACEQLDVGSSIVMGGHNYVKKTNAKGESIFYSTTTGSSLSAPAFQALMQHYVSEQKDVSFKAPSDQSGGNTTISASAKAIQDKILSVKTKAAKANALSKMPVGSKLKLNTAVGSYFVKTETGFTYVDPKKSISTPGLSDKDVAAWISGSKGLGFSIEDANGTSGVYSPSTPSQTTHSGAKSSAGSGSGATASSSQTSSSSVSGNTTPAVHGKVTHSADAFTDARKNSAHWDKSGGMKTDALLRPVTGAVWKGLSLTQKESLEAYTGSSYMSINNALRSGGNASPSTQKRIDDITAVIDQCETPADIWLQRGTDVHALAKLFNTSEGQIKSAKNKGAQAILDLLTSSANYGQDKAFMSCGSAKGKGFSGSVVLNLYCPKGTRMMYAEPFSVFGAGHKSGGHWNGESKTSYVSGEHETILQRGTKMVPRKVSIGANGKIYVDVDVIGQDY